MFVNQCGINVHGITLTIFNSLYPYIQRMKLSQAASNNSLTFMPFIVMMLNLYMPVWINITDSTFLLAYVILKISFCDIDRLCIFYISFSSVGRFNFTCYQFAQLFNILTKNLFSRASSFPYYTFEVTGLGYVALSQDLSNRLLSFMGKVTSKIFCSIPQCPNSLLTQKETKHEPETEY